MLSMLLAYDDAGNVIATLDHLVARDDDGRVIGLVDFDAHEQGGGELTDVWTVESAAGSKTWPEWLGSRAHDFTVELDGEPGRKRAVALVHRESGERRERATIEAAIAEQVRRAGDQPADIRDIVGGPDRPLKLTRNGTTARTSRAGRSLPIVRAG